ncbi:MAG: hypothetical protein BMS9Abin29_0004 [Gemmatimonadota bacterium]|nr:MAG: hypothetical protein BMS9Abin29_0004 [Gemmatimonadota bacterium]
MPVAMRDPKTIITPDAFSVAPFLLGTPLARPWRRLLAVWIDLLLVALVTLLTSGVWFILGIVITAFLLVRAGKSGPDDRRTTGFRVFLGCAGLTVLTVTISVFLFARWLDRRGGLEHVVGEVVAQLDSGAASIGDPERIAEDPSSGQREVEFTDGLDDIGFGLGWWTMYFAILMPLMKGQTPGKKALGIRVVRLDGQTVTWWHAFERAGGYAAGFATGFLGFLQIYWDPNRQAIHDKIAGTVVIRDGAPKVQGLWDAPSDVT